MLTTLTAILGISKENFDWQARSQNSMNRLGVSGRSSKYKGVSEEVKGKEEWKARVKFEGNFYPLGIFKTEVEAAMAYNAFIKAHCPEFGYLNPIHGATADEEPTAVKEPPKRRQSKLRKLTPKGSGASQKAPGEDEVQCHAPAKGTGEMARGDGEADPRRTEGQNPKRR